MTIKHFMYSVLALALAASCFAGDKVVVDYNKDFSFASVKTYAWQEGTPADPLMQQRIDRAIESELARHGMQKSDSAPDVFVVTHVLTREDVRLREWGFGPFRLGNSTIDIDRILIGTLVVDILDKNKQLVWRGIANGTLSDKPEKVEAKINKSVEKLFEKFPPGHATK
jgi:hypothetical protein